jgi:integrase/recombinase XerD
MIKHPCKGQQKILRTYYLHLREVAGLAPKTCHDREQRVGQFLAAIPIRRVRDLRKLSPAKLVNYLTVRSTDYESSSLQSLASSLRSFLRFVQQQGWSHRPLDLAVPKVACGPHNDLPVYLTPQQLQKLLTSWDRRTAEGKRDWAIGLCLARLGLRAGEAAMLRLEDCQWRQGRLRLAQSKNGEAVQLPLLRQVGEAISGYLRFGRPACPLRQVFLLHHPPRPMDAKAISGVIQRALRDCAIQVPRAGAHLLRHTLASHLVQQGASLKAVADVLRHRDLNSAAVYAHVDVPSLRKVAQPWPQEAAR